MRLRVTERAGGRRIRLTGRASVSHAPKLKEALCEAFRESGRVTLDASGLDEADLSVVQVLLAARRTAIEDGVDFEIAGGRDLLLRSMRANSEEHFELDPRLRL